MAVKASATITLTQYRDTQSVTRYYKLQPAGSSAPLKPETKPPSSDWTDSEPACDISKELYFCDLTIFSNGEGEYSKVSKSTSYEAAKQAYNKANAAKDSIDNLEIGGRNLARGTAEMIKGGSWETGTWRDSGASNTYNYSVNDSPVAGVNKGILVKTATANNRYGVTQDSCPILSKQVTFSVWAKGTAGGKITLQSVWWNGITNVPNWTKIFTTNGSWQYLTLTTDITNATVPNGKCSICYMYWTGVNANDTCVFVAPKLEYGNKATDWTPAPEDVDAGINDVDSKINDVTSNIYAPGSTLLDGSKINDGSLSINQMDDTVAGTYSDPTTKRGTMEWKDDALHIKSVDSNAQNTYETVIGGDGIKFNWNGTETASIDQDELRINKTVVINAMEVGNWSWAIHPTTGNLMVKWNGGK